MSRPRIPHTQMNARKLLIFEVISDTHLAALQFTQRESNKSVGYRSNTWISLVPIQMPSWRCHPFLNGEDISINFSLTLSAHNLHSLLREGTNVHHTRSTCSERLVHGDQRQSTVIAASLSAHNLHSLLREGTNVHHTRSSCSERLRWSQLRKCCPHSLE
jgi:hypothetical protein